MKVKIGPYKKYRWYHRFFNFSSKPTVSVRIDPWDTWSMDCTLAPIILPMLKQLKETTHGAPWVDNEDVPEHLRRAETPLEDFDEDDNWHSRWDWVLDEMIWTFEQKCRDDWMDDYYGPFIRDERLGKFEWIDSEGREKHQKRMTNGFRLFGKYYEGLWD